MDCTRAREAASARLDGEPVDGPALDVHLAGCAACRGWSDAAQDATRLARLRPVAPPADLTARVAAGSRAQGGLQPQDWPLVRVLLLVLGLVQLVLSLPVLLGDGAAASLHVSREVGVTDLALAVGLLAAVWQPWRAAGMLPVVGVLAVGLAAVAVVDVAAGRVQVATELPHLLAPVSALLLHLLRRHAPPPRGAVPAAPPGLRAVADDERRAG